MATTREVMSQMVLRELGGARWIGLGTSSAGEANGTTLVDTALSGLGNERLNEWFAICRSGDNDGEHRQISDFVSSTGASTVREAFTAQVASGVTFDLSQYDFLVIYEALNAAIRECYNLGHLFISKRDESIVVDNLLLNSDFETFAASNFTNWTLAGAGASVAQSTTIFWHGADCAAVTAGAGAAATYGQAVNASPVGGNFYKPGERSFTFGAFVYATAANTARLQITDGTDTASSDYHSGNDGWEWLEVTLSPGSNIGTVTVQLQVAASGTGRIDAAVCYAERLTRYSLPSDVLDIGVVSRIVNRLDQNALYVPIDGWEIQEDDNIRYLILKAKLPAGTRLQLQGRYPLSDLSTAQSATGEADTVEIDSPRTKLLAMKAAEMVLQWKAMEAPLGEQAGFESRRLQVAQRYQDELRGGRMVATVRSPMRRW